METPTEEDITSAKSSNHKAEYVKVMMYPTETTKTGRKGNEREKKGIYNSNSNAIYPNHIRRQGLPSRSQNFEMRLGTPACSIRSWPRSIQPLKPSSLESEGKSSQTAFSESAYVDQMPLGTSAADQDGSFAMTHV